MDKVVVYSGTRNVYEHMLTSVKSLIDNTGVDRVYFLIEDDVFPYDIPDIIMCINVSGQEYFRHDGPNYHNSWSYMCLMRAAYAKLFPQYDVVLSLDNDVIVNKDISELWDIDLTDYYYAGVAEVTRMSSPDDIPYINSGVLLMNLGKLRAFGMDDVLISALDTKRWDCPEQDAINYYCKGHMLRISNTYNAIHWEQLTGEIEDEKITHYAGVRYWKHYPPVKKYATITWEEILHTEVNQSARCDERVAVYAGTRNLYPGMVAAAKSIIYNNGADRVYFLIEDDEFPEQLPDCVECINVSGQTYFDPNGPNYHSQWTYMAMMKIALTKLFPQLSRVLYLDVDTIVNDEIDLLWNLDLTDYYFAATQESYARVQHIRPYYNSGVIMFNLDKMRQDFIDDQIIEALNTRCYDYPEQDMLNDYCHGSILDFPEEYNAMSLNFSNIPMGYERIRHFTFSKPYDRYPLHRKYRLMSWDTALENREKFQRGKKNATI